MISSGIRIVLALAAVLATLPVAAQRFGWKVGHWAIWLS